MTLYDTQERAAPEEVPAEAAFPGPAQLPSVAFALHLDPTDIRTWSGTPWHAIRALRTHGVNVIPVGPLETNVGAYGRALQTLYARRGRRFHAQSDPSVVAGYARQVEAVLERHPADIVLSTNPLPVAALAAGPRVVIWNDATYELLHEQYPNFTAVGPASVKAGHRVERMAMERADLLIYSSTWAARSAEQFYGAPREKLSVIPYGANIVAPPTRREAHEAVGQRARDRCELLWVGADWDRKGGKFAVEVTRQLRRLGVNAFLTVVGCEPPHSDTEAFVRMVGYLDKSIESERGVLASLMARSHFLLLPSRADCTPMVVGEAGAYGVPTLANAVGGVPGLIDGGANGHLFTSADSPATWAARIALSLKSFGSYAELCVGARRNYEQLLSWEAAMPRLLRRLRALALKRHVSQLN